LISALLQNEDYVFYPIALCHSTAVSGMYTVPAAPFFLYRFPDSPPRPPVFITFKRKTIQVTDIALKIENPPCVGADCEEEILLMGDELSM